MKKKVYEGHPIVGTWEWQQSENCREIYMYFADGTLVSLSGDRRYRDDFALSGVKDQPGLYRLKGISRINSDGLACSGSTEDTVGQEYEVFVAFNEEFESMIVYYEIEMQTGFGPLTRVSK